MFYVKLVLGRVSRASNDACHEIFSRQVAQMLRNGLRIITAVICGACIIYVHPDIAYQGAIMRLVKKGLHGLRAMCSCLARAQSQK